MALQKHLAQFFDSPEVSVDVLGYNSKVFYVITDGAGLGDNVRRIPVTGNETVLDAVAAVGGLSQLSSKEVWVARPAPGEFGCEQILPVDYAAITRGGSAATNYQLLPGDRVFIAEDNLIRLQQLPGQADRPGGTPPRRHLAGQLHHPQPANHGPRLQPFTHRILIA